MQKAMQTDILNKVGARHSRKDQQKIQDAHDAIVAAGAHCLGNADDTTVKSLGPLARIFKVDESLGLVMGWAIICKRGGQDYYDLNVDPDGSKVPEHIPEDSMLKAAMDFMLNSRMGNVMHAGEETGTYAFAWPMTSEIAKAMGIQTSTTGLMVAYKPPPELMSKFVDGTYKGFSIEGRRVKVVEEMEDAA